VKPETRLNRLDIPEFRVARQAGSADVNEKYDTTPDASRRIFSSFQKERVGKGAYWAFVASCFFPLLPGSANGVSSMRRVLGVQPIQALASHLD
jgi:hypothetical protein